VLVESCRSSRTAMLEMALVELDEVVPSREAE
jgi:hypothetical protein